MPNLRYSYWQISSPITLAHVKESRDLKKINIDEKEEHTFELLLILILKLNKYSKFEFDLILEAISNEYLAPMFDSSWVK